MDFQVHKNKVFGVSGQASVEYVLLLVVITTAVIGLVGFSDTIKGKIESSKMNLVYKLGGTSDLSRSDFTFKNIDVKGPDGGADDADGAGGKGKKARGGRGGEGGGGDDADGSNPNAGGRKGKKGGAGDSDDGDYGDEDLSADNLKKKTRVSSQEAGGSVSYSREQTSKARRAAGKEDEGSYTEEEDEGSELLRASQSDEFKARQAEEEAAKRWNIFKFLIIIAIIFFFIVIVLKARNARD